MWLRGQLPQARACSAPAAPCAASGSSASSLATIRPGAGLLGREFREGSFGHGVFAKNCARVFSADVARLSFAAVYDLSRQATSDAHFTADGPRIASWASHKGFVRKDGADAQ